MGQTGRRARTPLLYRSETPGKARDVQLASADRLELPPVGKVYRPGPTRQSLSVSREPSSACRLGRSCVHIGKSSFPDHFSLPRRLGAARGKCPIQSLHWQTRSPFDHDEARRVREASLRASCRALNLSCSANQAIQDK